MLEDDVDDRFITASTLTELGYPVRISFAKTSDELFSVLQNSDKPFLILIDYNSLPLGAIEILKLLKADEQYRSIPVVVLGESSSPKYIDNCYSAGASSYIRKPTSLADTEFKIDAFFKYWLTVVEPSSINKQQTAE